MSAIRLEHEMQHDAARVLWATGHFDTKDIAGLTGLPESEVFGAVNDALDEGRMPFEQDPCVLSDGKDGAK